ncbi:MAG: hypothetical protein U1A23_04110 [Candidatus Sungbacteria bacterium]|nr:hypothetical protein [bacterium]MDZ4286088.1 hypothetical protein [Candidatus Sungbacteria bacterium]
MESNMYARLYHYLLGSVVLAALVLSNLGVFSNPDTALKTVHEHKYISVFVVDHSWFFAGLRGYPGGYFSRFTIEALYSNGDPATLIVYTGWYDPLVQIVARKQ